MTSVALDTVWLSVATDPSDYRSFPLMSALNVTTNQPGEVRQMASGRARLVLRAGGVKRSIAATFPLLDRTDIEWLEARAGVLLCVRDDRGRKIFATYLSAPTDENQGLLTGDVSLALAEVSFTDVV